MKKELVRVGMKVKFVQDTFLGLKEQTPLLENLFIIDDVIGDACVLSATIKGNTCSLKSLFNCADFEPYEEPKEATYDGSKLKVSTLDEVGHENVPKKESRWEKGKLKIAIDLIKSSNKPLPKSTTHQVKDLEGNVIEEKVVEDKPKGFVINLDALEEFGTNLETGEKITPKEILDKFLATQTILVRSEDNQPITQEFIESFGFVVKLISDSKKIFTKVYGGTVFIELSFADDCWTLELNSDEEKFVTQPSDIVFQDFTCTTQSELRFLLTKGRIDCSK